MGPPNSAELENVCFPHPPDSAEFRRIKNCETGLYPRGLEGAELKGLVGIIIIIGKECGGPRRWGGGDARILGGGGPPPIPLYLRRYNGIEESHWVVTLSTEYSLIYINPVIYINPI